MKKLTSAFTLSSALLAAPAAAQHTPDTGWHLSGDVSVRAGSQVAPLTGDMPYIPVYPQNTGAQGGGKLSLDRTFADGRTLSATAHLASRNTVDSSATGSKERDQLIAGGAVKATGLPAVDQAGVYAYAREQTDIGGPDRISLQSYGFDLRTEGISLIGYLRFHFKTGARIGGKTTSVDPPMTYVLSGVESGGTSVYLGALAPAYQAPQYLAEIAARPIPSLSFKTQFFLDAAEATPGPYHSRARLALSYDISKGIQLTPSAVLSDRGLDEGILKAAFTRPGNTPLFTSVEAGVVQNPATRETQPMVRSTMGVKF